MDADERFATLVEQFAGRAGVEVPEASVAASGPTP